MSEQTLRERWWHCIAPGKPDAIKKVIYLAASTSLGILVAFICYAWIEIKTIHSMYHQGNLAYFQDSQMIFRLLEYIFLASGAIGGMLAGHFFWQKLYVERAWIDRIEKAIKK